MNHFCSRLWWKANTHRRNRFSYFHYPVYKDPPEMVKFNISSECKNVAGCLKTFPFLNDIRFTSRCDAIYVYLSPDVSASENRSINSLQNLLRPLLLCSSRPWGLRVLVRKDAITLGRQGNQDSWWWSLAPTWTHYTCSRRSLNHLTIRTDRMWWYHRTITASSYPHEWMPRIMVFWYFKQLKPGIDSPKSRICGLVPQLSRFIKGVCIFWFQH